MSKDNIITPGGDIPGNIVDPSAKPIVDQSPADLAKTLNEQVEADSGGEGGQDPETYDPIQRFVQFFYEVITPQLKAVLSVGVPVRAELTQQPDGTLNLKVESVKAVKAIDMDNHLITFADDEEPTKVDDVSDQGTHVVNDGDNCDEAGSSCEPPAVK